MSSRAQKPKTFRKRIPNATPHEIHIVLKISEIHFSFFFFSVFFEKMLNLAFENLIESKHVHTFYLIAIFFNF